MSDELIDEIIANKDTDKNYKMAFKYIKRQLDNMVQKQIHMRGLISSYRDSNVRAMDQWERIRPELQLTLSSFSYEDLHKKRNEMYEAIVILSKRITDLTIEVENLKRPKEMDDLKHPR